VECGVASKKTLNAKNLKARGAKRLAELLIEISTGNAAAKRRLRLELAGAQSPAEVAREIRKRLTTIARSRSFVDWQDRRALVDDLEAQRRACEIRLRAERKAGELLKAMEKAKSRGSNQHQERSHDATAPRTLADPGISKNQSSRWQQLAEIPKDQFEAALAGSDKPSTYGIIAQFRQKPVIPADRRGDLAMGGISATSSATAFLTKSPPSCWRAWRWRSQRARRIPSAGGSELASV
jgi:hypothetical protein